MQKKIIVTKLMIEGLKLDIKYRFFEFNAP